LSVRGAVDAAETIQTDTISNNKTEKRYFIMKMILKIITIF
jgi:hypothetical protein